MSHKQKNLLTDTTPGLPVNGRTTAIQITMPYDNAAVVKFQWKIANEARDIVGARYTTTTSTVLPIGVPVDVWPVLESHDPGVTIEVLMESVPSV